MPISLPSEICFSRPSTDICLRSCSSNDGKLLRLGSANSPLPAQSAQMIKFQDIWSTLSTGP